MPTINSHTHLRNVLASTAPAEPPTTEHAGPCFGYTFRKNSAQRRCTIRPFSGSKSCWVRSLQTLETTSVLAPKNSRKIRFSTSSDEKRWRLFWMSLAADTKSRGVGRTGSAPQSLLLLFLLWDTAFLNILWEKWGEEKGGWRAGMEGRGASRVVWRERS